jgi:pimeloyl-ACP methyl ester carboxylesterase
VEIVYDDNGSGPEVLLLHSGVCDRRMWRPQSEVLSRSHRVVAPDLPGFGDSPLEPGEFSSTAELVRLLDNLDIRQVAVVGSSYGGRVALELVEEAPDRIRALVLLCPAYRGLDATATAETFDADEEGRLEAGDVDGAVELNVRTWLGPEADDATRDLVRTMQRRAFDVQLAADAWPEPPEPIRVDPDLSAIGVPVFVVTGGHDMDHFQNIARHLAATIPDAHLVELPWAGHLPSLERPAEVTALLTGFLAEPATGR